jgi:C-terminal processing protease CtpA/Prc
MVDDDVFEVLFVAPGTPAQDAGFEEGDAVVSINGVDVGFLDGILAVRELLRAEEGTEYLVGVERSGESKELRLALRDLY